MQPIIDAHFHIWRQQDLPWLLGPMVPRIFGPYEPLRRDYPIGEFLADQEGSGVAKAVYVQTRWPGCSGPRTKPAGRTPSSAMPT